MVRSTSGSLRSGAARARGRRPRTSLPIRLQEHDEDDPDRDGLISDADRCPHAAGPPEAHGCSDKDTDGDGVVDRLDECPEIEGHTDSRADKLSSLYISQRRVNSVAKALQREGVDASRITAKGFGRSAPIYDDSPCLGSDEELGQGCRRMTSKNRRVVFRIVRRGAPPPRPITGAPYGNVSLLPTKEGMLPTGAGVLHSKTALPTQAVLPSSGVLPEVGVNPGLPQATKALPDQGVLPRQGTPKKSDETAPAPKETAPKKP